MKRQNPVVSRSAMGLDTPLAGIDNLPNPIGVNMKAVEKSEEMPEVSMAPNNGDQKDVASPPFAVGKDPRYFEKQGGADPWPAMPGC